MMKPIKQIAILILFAGTLFCLPMAAMAEVEASDFLEGMEISGDLRVRYEYKEADVPDEDPVDRLRQRFRLGMKWNNPSENWTVAAGLATGGEDATSTNDTYSENEIFETGDIRLDYAYAANKLNDMFILMAGQQKNPFETTWLFWDSDVRPVGFTVQVDLKPAFITAGWYDVRFVNRDIAQMEAVQAGVKMDMVNVALAFYNYHRVDEFVLTDNMDTDFEYQIVDFHAESEIKIDPVKLNPRVQVFYNIGAKGEEGQSIQGGNLDPEEENLGWLVGAEAKIDRFKLRVDYAEIGADSVIPDLKDADFGAELNATDVKGFVVGVGCKLTKNSELNATAFLYEAKERDLGQDAKTYHIDLAYKF